MLNNYSFKKGQSPIVFTAIHQGHSTRPELESLFNLNEAERLREEDPFTGDWAGLADNSITVHHSRFEADLNRPRKKAVYQIPDDAWGLNIWKEKLPEHVVNSSLTVYDQFYSQAERYFDELFSMHQQIIVYDIHSYNHRREGPDVLANAEENPEINIGTKNMDRRFWNPVLEALTSHITHFNYNNRKLDVRENVKFKGGYFGEWLYEKYGSKICPISIEFKKYFMDELSGKPFENDLQLIGALLTGSRAPVLNALKQVKA